jgi:hypothetical protein
LSAANKMAAALERELFEHMPALAAANVRFASGGSNHHPRPHAH